MRERGCFFLLNKAHTYLCSLQVIARCASRGFFIGGAGEQLTLRVVAQYADLWNVPGSPWMTVEEFQHKNQVLNGYCAEIGSDPATLARSVYLLIDPRENPATTRQIVQGFIAAGATYIDLGPRTGGEGIARWLDDEIIQPLLEA